MTPEHLKKSIFTYAFRGMLVEQKDNEYVNEEGFKAVKDIPDDIDIPETWRWTYLPDIATICYGFPFNSEFFNETKKGRPLIRIRDIIGGKTSTYTTEDCPDEYVIKKGDMLVGMDGNFQVEYWGSEEALLNQRVCKIDANNDYLDQDYLYYYLPIILKEINGNVSFSTVKHLSAKILNAMLIPLPPIEEQHRIVAKIEEMLPYVDRYAEAYEKLEQFNAKFPEDMKKSILQYAIQGKLVEQRPEEGTAEELYQQIQDEKQRLMKKGEVYREKNINDIDDMDDLPDIPETWRWCRLGELTKLITKGSSPKWQGVNYTDKDHGILFVTSENVGNEIMLLDNEKYVESKFNDMHPASILQKGDLLTNIVGASIGRTAVYDLDVYNANINQAVCIIRLVNTELKDYILKFLQSPYAVKHLIGDVSNGGRPNLSLTAVTNLMIALPPLNEQKRIITKLNQILPYCDQLIK